MNRWLAAVLASTLPIAATLSRAATSFEVREATIVSTQAALRAHQVTVHQLTATYLARIRAFDQPTRLNAVVVLNADALADADRLDAEFARTGKLKALQGIVVMVKDNYETRGLQTAAGSLAMRGYLPRRDAFMVQKLREAGAVIIAKSNMAEWAFSPYKTESSIAGITRNPYALDRVPAGSSGGTAASVAANLAEVGLGTDTGNSIRGPSSHNALVGIRPTIGLTSRAGIVPLFNGNDVGGPMARSVADAAAVLSVVAGVDAEDPVTALAAGHVAADYTKFLDKDGLKGARIGVFRRYLTDTSDPEIRKLTDQAAADLASQGATLLDPFDLPEYEALTKNLWCGNFRVDLDHYLTSRAPNAPYHSLADIVASGLYLPYIEEPMKGSLKAPATDERREPCPDVYHDIPKIAFRDALLRAMQAQHLDALVYPTWSNAPRKVGDMQSPAGDNSQILSPQSGFPAITVPMGYTHGQLPAGLTFLGKQFDEPTLIKFAYAYEQSTHHRRPPPGFGASP